MPTATPAARPAVSPSTKASNATTASVVPPGVGVAAAPTAGRGQGALDGTAAVNVPDGVGPPNPAVAPCTGGGAGVGHEDEYTPDGWDGAADVARGAAANGADAGPGEDDDCGDGGATGGATGTRDGVSDVRGGETDTDGASGVGRAAGIDRARGGGAGGAVRGGNGGGSALWGATLSVSSGEDAEARRRLSLTGNLAVVLSTSSNWSSADANPDSNVGESISWMVAGSESAGCGSSSPGSGVRMAGRNPES